MLHGHLSLFPDEEERNLANIINETQIKQNKLFTKTYSKTHLRIHFYLKRRKRHSKFKAFDHFVYHFKERNQISLQICHSKRHVENLRLTESKEIPLVFASPKTLTINILRHFMTILLLELGKYLDLNSIEIPKTLLTD